MSRALANFREKMKKENESNYVRICGDRRIVPDYAWSFRAHRTYIDNKFGSINGPDAAEKAGKVVDEYNRTHGTELAKMKQTESHWCHKSRLNRLPSTTWLILLPSTTWLMVSRSTNLVVREILQPGRARQTEKLMYQPVLALGQKT